MNEEIREVYNEDTIGRRWHPPVTSKNTPRIEEGTNGDVTTLNMNKKLSYSEFKALSDDLKVLYIRNLRSVYGVTGVMIAEMLGITAQHFTRTIVTPLKLNGLFVRGAKPTAEQQAKWDKFIGVEETPVIEVKNEPPMHSSRVTEFGFTQKGELNTDELVKRIEAMVGNGINCEVMINIRTMED